MMKKITAIALAVTLALSLCACGGKSDSPYVGKWNAVGYSAYGMDMSVEDMGASTLDIKANGSISADFMGNAGSGTWEETDGGITIKSGGDELPCAMEGSTLVMEMSGVRMLFEKEGGFTAAAGGSDGAAAQTADALSGDWYGWWSVSDATDEYESVDGYWWDLCATIKFDADGSGTIDLWDEDYTRSDLLGSVTIKREGEDAAVSTGGDFCDDPITQGEWKIAPNAGTTKSMIAVESSYKDENGSFTYTIHLRPWGFVWDDVEESELPYYYADWYLPLVKEGKPMPDSIDVPDSADAS